MPHQYLMKSRQYTHTHTKKENPADYIYIPYFLMTTSTTVPISFHYLAK